MRKNLTPLARLAKLLADADLYCPACDSTRLQWRVEDSKLVTEEGELSTETGEIIVPGCCKKCNATITAHFQLDLPDVVLED